MKILVVTPCGLPVPAVKGGAVLTLMESLMAVNEIEHKAEFTFVGVYDEAAKEKAKDYPSSRFIFVRFNPLFQYIDNVYEKVFDIMKHHHKVAKRYLTKEQTIYRIKRLLKEQNYDRVVFQNAGYLLNVLKDKEVCRKYNGKMYYHLHNDIPGNIYVDGVKKCKLLLISEYLKRKLAAVCGPEILECTKVVKNGIDVNKFSKTLDEKEKSEIKKRLGIPLENKVILFAGRIDPTKGIEEVCNAFSCLSQENLTLLIVGSNNFGSGQTSPFEIRMKKVFHEMGEHVKFTGFIPYDDMWKYYKISDLAVLPSMWEEPAGLTMIEACAAGIPLITTNCGGIPEYVSSDYVMLLDKNNHVAESLQTGITDVIENIELWKEKALSAQRYVAERFSIQNYYHSFIKAVDGEQ